MHAAFLRYFSVVARAGSIRAASEQLHVASSAISRQIQKVEDELGTPLFERLPGGLRLTQAGKILLAHANRTLNDFEVLKGELGALRGEKTGTVSIASLDSLLVSFLPEQIGQFHRAHPKVDFRVRSGAHGAVATMVAEGEADLGITFSLARPEDTEFVAPIPMPLMAMVAADHPLARRRSVTLAECASYNLLLQLDTAPIRSLIEMELSVLNRTGRVLAASNNLMMLKPLILEGNGVAFYTPLGMVRELSEGSIVAVALEGTRLGGLELGLLVPRRRKLTQAAEALIEQLSDGLAELRDTPWMRKLTGLETA
ncbi:DNA-binding transcriptional LysR family regulator [Limimaricola variabilis]|jgi:DNA-binding transcriptional LysR family regulator|uniref:DNA-binding transcriptional LysR family regulator n=1 Tax=Limimaricola variabilis TaxID=1492771 RepID=A0ABR6HQ27_9RHOB|nr:LysR family transcriptional regulator [Limimaricola variabilis]MBB3712641.1 DNA-binding transcriptional LysR family regulator [Limimaricola variabilis]